MTTITPIVTGTAAHIGTYADAVSVTGGGTTIYVSGTPGLREDGSRPADFNVEARLAWQNVEAALAKAGAQLADIVSVRQWLTDPADLAAYLRVRGEVIKHQPAFMLGILSGLVWPNLRIEIEVTAVVSA